jgi:hypothetical protein
MVNAQGPVIAIAILLHHRQAREIAKTQRPCFMDKRDIATDDEHVQSNRSLISGRSCF